MYILREVPEEAGTELMELNSEPTYLYQKQTNKQINE